MILVKGRNILRLSRTTVCKAQTTPRKNKIYFCSSIGDHLVKITLLDQLITPISLLVSHKVASQTRKKISMIWPFSTVNNLVRRPASHHKRMAPIFWIQLTYPLTSKNLMIVNLKWAIWIETIIICHKRSLPVSRVTGKVASIWISNSTMKGDKSKQWNIKILLSSINNSQPLNYHRIIRLRVPKCNLLSKLKVKIRSLRSIRSPLVKAWERR